MRVRVTDEKTGETFEAWLDDVVPDPDDRFFVRQSIEGARFGFIVFGGGAGPAFMLEKIDSPKPAN